MAGLKLVTMARDILRRPRFGRKLYVRTRNFTRGGEHPAHAAVVGLSVSAALSRRRDSDGRLYHLGGHGNRLHPRSTVGET